MSANGGDESTKFLSRHCIEHVDNVEGNKSSSGKTLIILLSIFDVLFYAKTEGTISDQIHTTIDSNGKVKREEVVGELMLVCEYGADSSDSTNSRRHPDGS